MGLTVLKRLKVLEVVDNAPVAFSGKLLAGLGAGGDIA